jgi:tetratricopeptide (TPR) repeat protein
VLFRSQTIDELAAVRKGNSAYQQAEKVRAEAMQLIEKGGEVNTRIAHEKFKEASKLYQNAEISYRKGMATTKNFLKANYNLANSLYRQEKYEDAGNSFKYIAEQKENDRVQRAKAFHNYGNSLLNQEKYKECIEAYKNALKLNPKDQDTKYNLEYARKKLMQQQQQEQNQDSQDNKDNQDNKDQQQQNQDNKEEKKEQQERQQQRQQQQQDKRQLDALQQNERQTQQKLAEEEMKKGGKAKQEKDW